MSASLCLLDTGPIVALLSENNQDHERAKNLFSQHEAPFRTCESVLSEACFLLARVTSSGPEKVLSLAEKGFFEITFYLEDHWDLVCALLEKYRDQSISLADACLIRCAEIHNEARILTFDSDFEVYRWGRNKKFEILK